MSRTRAALVIVLVIGLVSSFVGLVWLVPVRFPATMPSSPASPSGGREIWPGYSSPDRQLDVASSVKPEGFIDPPAGAGVQRYLDQKVDWQPCGDRQCASVAAPLDWASPDEQAITLSLVRVASASGRGVPLFVNPGGPGASGVAFARAFPPDALGAFDLIGWDPRGSGSSTPVVCGTREQTDAYFAADPAAEDEAGYQAYLASERAFARQCREHSGVLLDHVSTRENVADLELLRHLLGGGKLNYFGVSYGTFIGAMYAEFYPHQVGRLVLDGAVNITDDEVIQAEGFDRSLKAYVDWCVQHNDCPLSGDAKQAQTQLVGFVNSLATSPLPGTGRALNRIHAARGIGAFLYSDASAYPALSAAIKAAMGGSPDELLRSSDFLTGRQADGRYDPISYAFPAIGCLDSPDKGLVEARERWADDQVKAPIFGRWFGPSVTCEVWTAAPEPAYKLTGKGAAPIMVVGTTGDSATPYEQAVSMAKQLESGFLVTFESAGHGSVTSGNPCLMRLVRDYLRTGAVPPEGTVCR